MKQIIFFATVLAVSLNVYSQTDSLKRKTTGTLTTKPLNTSQRPVMLQQLKEKNVPIQNLPDLKITAFNVRYISSEVVDGKIKHTLEVTYTVKNEGTVAVAANSIGMGGWIGYETAYPKIIPGCGSLLTTFTGQYLNPGATYNGSYLCSASFDKNNHPIYTLYADDSNAVTELNEQNNTAQMTILF